jgi:hypothetical protein
MYANLFSLFSSLRIAGPSAPLRYLPSSFVMNRMTDAEPTHATIGAATEVHRSLGPVYWNPFSPPKTDPPRLQRSETRMRLSVGAACSRFIVKIKAIECIAPLHETVMPTYRHLSDVPSGLL